MANQETQFIGEERDWVYRWREPRGSRAVILGFLILALITVIAIVVYATGGTVLVWAHMMYLPIIVAAAGFGIYGGIAAALIGALVLGPYMPMDVAHGVAQPLHNWILRMVFFILVGTLSGLISRALNRQIARIKRREEHIRYILNNTKDVIFQIDLKGNYIYGNVAAEQLTGYPLPELLQMNMTQLVAPEYHALLNERLRRRLANEPDEKTLECEIRHKDGRRIWTEQTARNVHDRDGQLIAIQGVARDISGRKRAEEAMTLFRALVDHANDAIEVVDPDTWRYLDVNEKASRIHGYTRQEYLALTVSEIDPQFAAGGPKTQNAHLETMRQFGVLVFESEHRRKDGSTFPVEVNASYIHLERDYILAVVRDITERKQTDRRIRQLNRVYAVLSGINELIVRERNLQALFEGACRIAVEKGGFRLAWIGLLKNPDEPVQLAAQAGATPDTLAALQKVFSDPALGCAFTKRAVETGSHAVCNDVAQSPESAPWRELALERGYLSLVSLPLNAAGRRMGVFNLYAGETGFFDADELRLLDELASDISFALEVSQREAERLQLEDQFRQSQKMEAVGQLASGVAHDFNNILGIIQMQSDLLKAEGGLSPVQMGFALEIGEAAQRAAALTRQLLLFSRRGKMEARELDLNQSINDMTKLLRRTLGENIQLQFKFSMQPLFVNADAGMMDQVLMNLAVNARDAMPKGGKIVIETSAVEFDESVRAQSAQASPGSFVCLGVSDTGTGIPPEILPKIFEPFFTTKDVGKGTGLGLATVFGIVQQHQGWINVYSEVGHGTVFRIYIPRLARVSDQKFVVPLTEPARGGNETILLVEDEPKLRASVRNILSRLGYNVLEAPDAASALEVWKKHRNEVHFAQKVWNQQRDGIHLLLTDIIMPGGMNGKDLGAQLLKDNPGLKVIYVSGYSAEIAVKDFPLKEGVNFLTKPFQAQKLAQTIRNCLDKN